MELRNGESEVENSDDNELRVFGVVTPNYAHCCAALSTSPAPLQKIPKMIRPE